MTDKEKKRLEEDLNRRTKNLSTTFSKEDYEAWQRIFKADADAYSETLKTKGYDTRTDD